ncbi:F-box/FBD/LRR-repeat protein At5g44980 isoform X2 [Arabidopsis lyrata subsp. lyrata]|nr:F-box/FBD/LRR-repeat protein At5g44980 isoform X2 [Arabidopsis lyrata subsp. lyrata]|eukprot:XP_020870364.1 F-box/FBD/LRR-repeat protein At5g44980 isoform X2 [Arabidopsis lyrata subsp. lyrata]
MDCDYISELPDSLLTQILLNLPTKDSVKTSVLSKRWRNLWLNVPGLDLGSLQFPNPYEEGFTRFMDRFMEFNCGSHLQKFKIQYTGKQDQLMELICTVVDRGIQHLDVCYYSLRYGFMRENIYKSKTLVSLKLFNLELKKPEFVASLPCLKIMHLGRVCRGEDGPLVVEKLISGCPALEYLKLIRPFDISSQKVLLFLRVSSQTLKSLGLYYAFNKGDTDFSVEIDAPRLKYMIVKESQSDNIVVKNLSSLFMINIRTKCYQLRPEDFNILCGFLTGISRVRHMIIDLSRVERLYPNYNFGPIPKFLNLYYLNVEVSRSSLQLLPAFLESSPNLKTLILDFRGSSKLGQIDFTNLHRCLISTLEYVEIKKGMIRDETGVKLVNYFLENSAILKKLTLSFTDSSSLELESCKKLLTSTKLSPTCQVIIV